MKHVRLVYFYKDIKRKYIKQLSGKQKYLYAREAFKRSSSSYLLNLWPLSKLYKNTLDKACFVHDSAYARYKDLDNRFVSDKELKESD